MFDISPEFVGIEGGIEGGNWRPEGEKFSEIKQVGLRPGVNFITLSTGILNAKNGVYLLGSFIKHLWHLNAKLLGLYCLNWHLKHQKEAFKMAKKERLAFAVLNTQIGV